MSDILRKVEVKPRIEDFNHNSRFLFESDWSLLYNKPPELIALPELIAGKQSVEYLTVNTARTTAPKTTEEEIEFQEGVIYYVRFTYGTSVASPTLNGVPIQLGITNASTTTLSIADNANVVVPMFYDATRNTLQLLGSHRTSDTSYQGTYNGWAIQISHNALYRYKLIGETINGTFAPMFITDKTSTTVVSPYNVSAQEFKIGGRIEFYNTTATVNVGATATNKYTITASANILTYALNSASGSITTQKNVYLVGTIGAGGGFKLDTSNFWTQTLPTTANGKYYMLLGYAYNATTGIALYDYHPVYYYNNGIKEYKRYDVLRDKLNINSITFGSTAKLRSGIGQEDLNLDGNLTISHDLDVSGLIRTKAANITSGASHIAVFSANPDSTNRIELKSITTANLKTVMSLNNVDNTSDVNKPISTATQTALNNKQATLNGTGFVKMSGTTVSYDNSTYSVSTHTHGKITNAGTIAAPNITSGTTHIAVFNSNPNTTAGELKSIATLPVSNGGTGKASVTANSYLKGNGTGALVERTYAEVKLDLGLNNVANTSNYLPTDATGKVTTDLEFATTKKIKNTSEVEFYDKAKIVYDDTSKSLKFIFS